MKKLYCITCPNGCLLSVTADGSDITVEGNGCNRGVDFAVTEMTNPTRSLTTTVRTTFPGVPVLPVRTDGEIPKDRIIEAMGALREVVVSSVINCGDTVIENLLGSGVRVIATSDALLRTERQYTKR